ncbi:hypothetical protein [Rhodococcus sp. SJ-2]
MSPVLRLDGDEKVEILDYFIGVEGDHLAEICIPKTEGTCDEDQIYPVPVSRLTLTGK